MPTNRQNNLSRTKVPEDKGSLEMSLEDPSMTIEIVHAVNLLNDHFKKLGYDEWILGPVCSRKLLTKVQQRIPNPVYVPMPTYVPEPPMLFAQPMTEPSNTYRVVTRPYTEIEAGPPPIPRPNFRRIHPAPLTEPVYPNQRHLIQGQVQETDHDRMVQGQASMGLPPANGPALDTPF